MNTPVSAPGMVASTDMRSESSMVSPRTPLPQEFVCTMASLDLTSSTALVAGVLATARPVMVERGASMSTALLEPLRGGGRGHLLDQALERMIGWGGHDQHARDELYALGSRLDMSREAVELAEARFQKRTGGVHGRTLG